MDGEGCDLLLDLKRKEFDQKERGEVQLNARNRKKIDEGKVSRVGGRRWIGVE